MTAAEFMTKWKNIPTSHACFSMPNVKPCPRDLEDFSFCTCGLSKLWDARNADLRSVSDPENLPG